MQYLDTVADTSGWDWADMDGKRLVWAEKGCLWAGEVRTDGIQKIRLLHDFNGMKFEPLAAPYQGGGPVVTRPSPSPRAAAAIGRRKPRPPSRKKPNRSRVRPDDDTND